MWAAQVTFWMFCLGVILWVDSRFFDFTACSGWSENMLLPTHLFRPPYRHAITGNNMGPSGIIFEILPFKKYHCNTIFKTFEFGMKNYTGKKWLASRKKTLTVFVKEMRSLKCSNLMLKCWFGYGLVWFLGRTSTQKLKDTLRMANAARETLSRLTSFRSLEL